MAIKKPRTTKKRTHDAASGCGSTVATVEMPPHPHPHPHPHGPGGATHIQPAPPPLPPGVYFSPSREECLGFLNRRIAGDTELADARGYIFGANVYDESPEALRRRHPPASVRGRAQHAWWFLSETRFQSSAAGGGASKRADRRVQSGGYWRLEQSKEELKKQSKKQSQEEDELEEEMEEEEADGAKNSFGFYVGNQRKHKTPWLMQEFTSANDDGAGKRGVPALYRVYVSPRANDKQLGAVFGEDEKKKGPDGKKRPARAMVPQPYFDGIADLLPEGSVRLRVRGAGDQQAPPPQVAASEGLLDYQGQHVDQYQQQYLGQFQQQEGQDLGPYQQQQYLGQFQQQEGQDLGPYQQQQQYLGQFQQQEGQFLGPYQQQQQYLGQFQQQDLGPYHQQQQQYLGQSQQQDLGPYQQQQGPFAPPEPRPASPELSGCEFEADDNLSMPLDEFLQMVNEQPAEMVDEQQPAEMVEVQPAEMDNEQPAEMIEEQPAETLEEGEPNWGSLGNIVKDDELDSFNEEG